MNKRDIKNILKEYVENDVKFQENTLDRLFKECVKKIYLAYKKIYRKEPDIPEITLRFDNNFKDGKIGAFIHPNNDQESGVMLIKPKAIEEGGEEYVKHIITHELIHAVLGHKDHEHNKEFHGLANLMGLPQEYRD